MVVHVEHVAITDEQIQIDVLAISLKDSPNGMLEGRIRASNLAAALIEFNLVHDVIENLLGICRPL